jgi:nucleotide-binding universal stress UspA family protein
MAGFTNLLFCATDDDDAAIRYVARLAATTSAGLTIADVIEDVPPIARRLLPRSWNLPALVRAQKQARIEHSAAVAKRLGVVPRTVLLTGSPIKALVREVVRGEHDLLAVGAATPGTVQCVGASATSLLREAACPVLLVHPSRRPRRPRVLVAVDTGPFVSKATGKLTATLVENAIWLAEKYNGELHVLHAWVPYGERMMVRAGVSDSEARNFFAGQREEARQDLERTLAPFHAHIAPARVHLVKGDPRVVIADFATSHRIDLLVVGTVARSGIAGRIIGNTAEAVLNQLPCSMLVVKPGTGDARARRATHKTSSRPGGRAHVSS